MHLIFAQIWKPPTDFNLLSSLKCPTNTFSSTVEVAYPPTRTTKHSAHGREKAKRKRRRTEEVNTLGDEQWSQYTEASMRAWELNLAHRCIWFGPLGVLVSNEYLNEKILEELKPKFPQSKGAGTGPFRYGTCCPVWDSHPHLLSIWPASLIEQQKSWDFWICYSRTTGQ